MKSMTEALNPGPSLSNNFGNRKTSPQATHAEKRLAFSSRFQ
jgi:hypothetical protein